MKTKRKLDSNTVLVFITIALFVVMYAIGCGAYILVAEKSSNTLVHSKNCTYKSCRKI